ncbi:hypothetical protein [Streptomyces sp. NPDC088752]
MAVDRLTEAHGWGLMVAFHEPEPASRAGASPAFPEAGMAAVLTRAGVPA